MVDDGEETTTLSHDVLLLFTGTILSAIITRICTVMGSVYTVKAAKRANEQAEQQRAAPGPSDQPWQQRVLSRLWVWKKVVLALVTTLLLAVTLIIQFLSLSSASSVQAWKEPTRSEDWLSWRKRVHEKLSPGPVTQKALLDALKIPLPSLPDRPAAVLRRDQAIADVLLSYDGVRDILKERLGIDNEFLGTGLSKPKGGESSYASASLHEYLVPNLHDTHENVWMWKMKPLSPHFNKRIREIIAGDPQKKVPGLPPTQDHNATFEVNRDELVERVEKRNMKIPPVIRFARFPEKFYKGQMGRAERARVFTSNLSEVWNLTVTEAAEMSGYTFTDASLGGETFFIWVFLPYNHESVVPATWGEVLRNLPNWLDEAKNKAS